MDGSGVGLTKYAACAVLVRKHASFFCALSFFFFFFWNLYIGNLNLLMDFPPSELCLFFTPPLCCQNLNWCLVATYFDMLGIGV
ncbi:hypothetical protein VNO78_34336 [Psophocarpus tetragonolobus]|uniref:Uncharacterized protein n=1 Tax=Psophocarpus tetragonolobus TaxID=3891 RepID=A0AAN9NZY7_PSOTE